MASFDFISEPRFRQTLESDYIELQSCVENEAWKAAHVLAGSIVEAVLTDYLLTVKEKPAKVEKVLSMPLGQLILECRQLGVLSQKTVELSAAVKEYRNLLHPGREMRLQERIDGNSALVVKALVEIIVDEISQEKSKTYGFTAEQMATKIKMDPSVLPILKHLLKDIREIELARFVLEVIPDSLLQMFPGEDYDDYLASEQLAAAHREALSVAGDGLRKAAARQFVGVLKEGSQEAVDRYLGRLFRPHDLELIDEPDREIVVDYLLSRLPESIGQGKFAAQFSGLGKFIPASKATMFIDPLVKAIISAHEPRRKSALDYVIAEHSSTKQELDEAMVHRLDKWIEQSSRRGDAGSVSVLTELRDEINLPF